MKEAYNFKKLSKNFHPSKSLIVWRLMLDKLPTNENLASRGFCIHLWRWLASVLNLQPQLPNEGSNMEYL